MVKRAKKRDKLIDRLELFTSRSFSQEAGRSMASLKRFKSKLLDEDEDIISLKRADFNGLYNNLFTLEYWGNKETGNMEDDPVKFYIFDDPRYKKTQKDRTKFVFNPNQVNFTDAIRVMFNMFNPAGCDPTDIFSDNPRYRAFLESFRLGRIDFCIDVPDYTVEELYQIIYIDNKARLHDSLQVDDIKRIIARKQMETFYIGRGRVMLRVYDKVKECKHRMSVCKTQGYGISEKLKEMAGMKQLSRIELQIRKLNRDPPVKQYETMKTLYDLVNCKYYDVFDDLKFLPIQGISSTIFERESWKSEAINCMIQKYGADRAMKKLPIDTRKKVKKTLETRKFPYNLNQLLTKEVAQWLKT
jgi:hypothetical protein